MCLYRPNARWGGEFEWPMTQRLKDHSWRIVKKGWVSGSENLLKNGQTDHSPHVVWEVFKKNDPSSSKNKLQHIQLSDTTRTSNGPGFYGQMKLRKLAFLAAHTQDGFGERRDKKYPMCTIKYNAVFSDVVGLYFCWRSWTSCLDTWHHGFYQIPTDKKSISDWLC